MVLMRVRVIEAPPDVKAGWSCCMFLSFLSLARYFQIALNWVKAACTKPEALPPVVRLVWF